MAKTKKTASNKPAPRAGAPRRRKAATAPRRRKSVRRMSAASPAVIKSTLMDMAFAAAGAVAASFIANQKFLDNQSETNKGLLLAAAGVATAVVFKQPRLAVGMGAVAGMKVLRGIGAGKIVGLAENAAIDVFPISESVAPALMPYGLEEADYANLSEASIYGNDYGSNYRMY